MSEKPDAESEFRRRLYLVSQAFSPSSPVTTRDLFSGRLGQMNRLFDVVEQRGQHALVYGERGVGKTSLAQVVKESVAHEGAVVAYFTCAVTDTYESIWRRACKDIEVAYQVAGVGFGAPGTQQRLNVSEMMPPDPSPDDVRRTLAAIATPDRPIVIFIDEFDRPVDTETRTLFADTIKILSDHGVAATLVLIGVGGAVSDLIAEHASIGRALVQIQMWPMTADEIEGIVRTGMAKAELEVDGGFVERIIDISQGLPHYTHLIAQHGARCVVEQGRHHVLVTDIQDAVELAVEDVSQTVREAYIRATSSNRETIFPDVLLACALATKNEIGDFGSADVREPLRRITGKDYDIPAFSSHLNDFSSDGARGRILNKRTAQARFIFRFVDPLLPPYVLMKGASTGLI